MYIVDMCEAEANNELATIIHPLYIQVLMTKRHGSLYMYSLSQNSYSADSKITKIHTRACAQSH